MAEELRSIEVVVKIHTNKGMSAYSVDAQTMSEAEAEVRELFADLRWES